MLALLAMAGCAGSRRLSQTRSSSPGTPSSPVLPQQLSSPELDSLFLAAERYKWLGMDKQALRSFSTFLHYRPGEPAAWYELALLMAGLQHRQEALRYAERAYKLDSANVWYASGYAELLGANKHFQRAADIYSRLARLHPSTQSYAYKAGDYLIQAGAYRSALNLFDSLQAVEGVREDLIYERQRIYSSLGKTDSAALAIRELIAESPDEWRYYGLLAALYDQHAWLDSALSVYQDYLKRNPGQPQAEVAMALLYHREGHERKYHSLMREVFLDPANGIEDKMAFAFPFLKYVEVDTAERSQALDLCRWITEAHRRDPRAFTLYGDMLVKCDRIDQALDAYRQSLRLDPSRYGVWKQLLFIYSLREQTDSLLKTSQEVIRRFPNQVLGWYFEGMSRILKGDSDSGCLALQRALQLHPDDTPMLHHIYATLGTTYQTLGKFSLSDSCFDKALRLMPDDGNTLNNYSFYLAQRGVSLHTAASLVLRALALSPDNYAYEDTYAWVLFLMKHYRQARTWMEKALAHPPARKLPGFWSHYAAILERLGKSRQARASFRKAQELQSP